MKFTKLKLLMLALAGLTCSLIAACGQATTSPASVQTLTTAQPPLATATAVVKQLPQTTTLATAKPIGNVPLTMDGKYIVVRFSEFYAPNSNTSQFSEKLMAAKDRPIKITGYMAPPLKPDLDFFVLTRIKLVVCPFCSTSTEWPQDIILVNMPSGKTVKQIEEPITITGKLEIGEAVDPATGFVSLLRLQAENVEVFKGS